MLKLQSTLEEVREFVYNYEDRYAKTVIIPAKLLLELYEALDSHTNRLD